MKRTIILIFLNLSFLGTTLGQKILIETDVNVYHISDLIGVKITIDFEADSVSTPKFDGFKIMNPSGTSTSTSFTNGKKKVFNSFTYQLKPQKSGEIIINSPIFYIDDKKIKTSKKITVLDKITEAEKTKMLRFKKFVTASQKPEGTFRYVIGNEFGYIEIPKKEEGFDGKTDWTFYRQLTDEEFESIKKIKP